MIIWSGYGFSLVIIFGISFAICSNIIPNEYLAFATALALAISATASWFIGKKLNEEGTKTLVDKETGEEIILKPNHSLFFINMQYWGYVFGGLGVIALIKGIITLFA